ncbi:MAG: hypothetical protein RI883_2173 [Bacteroidota bacterium]
MSNFSIAQLYTFKNFSHKDGLPIASVLSLAQTQDGTIWLGTNGAGLISYNGYNFEEFRIDYLENNHHVSSIIEEKKGLLFTSQYKGLYKLVNNSCTQIVASTIQTGEFFKVIKTDSSLLIIASKGIFRVDKSKLIKLYSFKNISETVKIRNVINLKNGVILLTSKGNFHFSNDYSKLIPLTKWLNLPSSKTDFIKFGILQNNTILFYDNVMSRELKVILTENDAVFKLDVNSPLSPLDPNQEIISIYGNRYNNKSAFITSENDIFYSSEKGYIKIAYNFEHPLEMCFDIIIDRNDDFWISSSHKALYKVSLEPFTKVVLSPIYSSSYINTIFKSKAGDIVISTMEGKTNIANLYSLDSQFKEYNFKTTCIVQEQHLLFLGTTNGLKIYDTKTKELKNSFIVELINKKLTFLFIENGMLWVGVAGEGLMKFNLKENFKKEKIDFNQTLYSHVYTAQITESGEFIYFGTNNGLIVLDRKKNEFTKIKTPKSIASYIGNSIKDVFGTIWFTGEKGLIGFLKSGEHVVIDKKEYFSSTLFYTLNSDKFGNLIIGTNKGLNIININEFGIVLNYRWYQGNSGFPGFETHMRSQFQDNNSIFVGTIEGLFLINTAVLQNISTPSKPKITLIGSLESAKRNNSFHFNFLVVNPKIKNIEYSYRIIGQNSDWTDFNSEKEIFINDLSNGDYTLEVKATYDRITFSEIGKYPITIKVPIWKSRWFVFFLLLMLVVVNILLINRKKSFSSGNVFETKETSLTYTVTPSILFFALIADISIHILCPLIDSSVKSNLTVTLISGFIMLALYLFSLTLKKNNKVHLYPYVLTTGFIVTISHNLFDVFATSLHPFYIIAIALINSLAPYIFERVKPVIIYSLIFILINVLISMQIDIVVYNKILFLIAVFFSAFFVVIATYLRYDSLEKLLFISGVINKGDVPTIAFNSKGIMTYVSENISNTISISNAELIGEHISFLNTFVPEEGSFRRVDLTKDFEDGKKYLVPMLSSTKEINWIEWSCKVFTENVKVIIGQNVTDRLEIETSYELLVQNAEDLIYQCDINGNFNFLNDRCFEKLEYSEEELMNQNSLSFIPEENVEDVKSFYKVHFDQRKETSYLEFPFKTKNGTIIWMGQHVTTLYKPGEKKIVTGFLALARDITLKREQQEIIKQQRDDITSSIKYAQKIQVNLLPKRENFNASFKETCIYYKPKDIVSGDFYWLERIDDITIVALADCTGHGVPGSFMTLLGINLLNNIVLEQRNFNPGSILNQLDEKLVQALPRESEDGNMTDGMEITICVFNHKTNELTYACAGSRFLLFESNLFTMLKGDTKHIGDAPIPEFIGFTNHYLKFNDNATLFLITDGFQDQFGGEKDKKYSFRRMLELFESNIRLPLSEQELIIQSEFKIWKGNTEQTDDVTVLILRCLIN